ncbi:MAG: cobalamin-dependent protein [Proteobacteria bacterium]|nr:cobalamin-dependent protein [Pseudomonadota bacterium]
MEPAGAASPVRVVTAAALFDGHDAAINIVRRILQAAGAEVIHLGHDRSVEDIVTAAVQEDADALAVSSYQGGHMEYFGYLLRRLEECGARHVRVYGGGGGVISPQEVAELQAQGVTRVFRPEDGQRLGLVEMVEEIVAPGRGRPAIDPRAELARLGESSAAAARLMTWFEEHGSEPEADALRERLEALRPGSETPVVGLTGTGGSGKSSLIDELIGRLRLADPERSIGVVLFDPTRRRRGGALLGDRLRLNAIEPERVFVRSLATRRLHRSLSRAAGDAVRVLRAAGCDLVLVETAGIGQSDSEIVDLVDYSLYVMTPEYGAPSQLEKIDMLDLADAVALNKFDRPGAPDALRDVRKQWRRNQTDFQGEDGQLPVFPTIASRWNDPGTDRLVRALETGLAERGFAGFEAARGEAAPDPDREGVIPRRRVRYLAEVADAVRSYRTAVERMAGLADRLRGLDLALRELGCEPPPGLQPFGGEEKSGGETARLRDRYDELLGQLDPETRAKLAGWPEVQARYRGDEQEYRVRGRPIGIENYSESLSGLRIPRVALPAAESWSELVRYWALENRPGQFPFTAGVFPFQRTETEAPARMFAGEGPPERTNRRFHLLAGGQPAARLSTAFDSVTLYGRDPHERPDVYGKVGTSGVSVCSVDDAKKLYSGFDLSDPTTSVSMTINGPAPILLAMFFNAAIDQAVEKHLAETGRLERVESEVAARDLPRYEGPLPAGHSGLGLALLGVSGDEVVDADTYARLRAETLERVRGTVQADILKEDQAQNTCIYSTDFSLKLMGDVQEYFTREGVRNFYSVSISGYHMAEAGANPISQLAFTLANGFTYVEYYLSRGLEIDDFAPNLSFFFSNGLDPEYAVIGRVARRIWAVALRELYGASERSQKLKYHIQTSGRSLHAQEMSFNDVRTTIQALTALQDACNSLHTNAYDEAVTTPTEESVRRALAIQLILNREHGVLRNENSAQGAYFSRLLTDLVEEAVLREFERLADRGGVLGAMETMYQRGRIQDESLHYERLKHSGELPIVGVNTFENPEPESAPPRELVRASEQERRGQVARLQAFQARHARRTGPALERLQRVALAGGNVFEELMETVKVASLGQISQALFEVGGRYRRSM